jgi:hypothetical protein
MTPLKAFNGFVETIRSYLAEHASFDRLARRLDAAYSVPNAD